MAWSTPVQFRSLVGHLHPALHAAPDYGPLQELGAPLIGVEEHEGCRRQIPGHDQAGKASAGAEIEEVSVGAALLGQHQGREAVCVKEMAFDRSRAEEAGIPRLDQDIGENVVIIAALVGVRHRRHRGLGQLAGEMTM
jgi:hypothetical protein